MRNLFERFCLSLDLNISKTKVKRLSFKRSVLFVEEFNNIPSKEVLNIEVEKRNDVNEDQYREVCQTIEHLTDVPVDFSCW